MCGIAGIFSYRSASPEIDRAELRRIRDHMTVRGPDGLGEWLSEDGRIGFGHQRLSIIDLSDRGAQPMQSADGKLIATFNGEIYNYRTLRAELETKGYVFRSESDTEVLLQLYAEKGEGMVQNLRGMFAFGLWDTEKRELLLARDPYGVKPLYYSDDGRCLRFASQVKALVAGERVSPALDPAGLSGFCLFGSVPEPFTIRKEVRAVPAGCTLRIGEGGTSEPKPYFKISQLLADAVSLSSQYTTRDAESMVNEALRDSIHHHLVADVPVGVFLSAGIDSSTVAGLASEALGLSRTPLRSVNVAFEEFRGGSDDEAPLAAEVARLYGNDHSVRVVHQAEFEADLPRIFAALYMRNQLLRDTDWASMAHSLEIRVPLVDRVLLETLAPLPLVRDWAPGKTWLARAPRPGLPEVVIRRPKTGFLTPINEWLVRTRILQERGGYPKLPVHIHWSRRWALAVLSEFAFDDAFMAVAA